MQKQCKVTADNAGNVIIRSKNNPEYGYIRVEQDKMDIDNNGFARKVTYSALVHGTVETLKDFGWKDGDMISGTVMIKEQLEPFNTTDPDRDLKYAGKTGIVCCLDGQPIYHKSFFTFRNDAEDVKIAHNNGDAIKAYYATKKENDPLKTSVGIDEDTDLNV